MSPDSPEARLGRLETAVARLEQRTDDLATDVRTLAPLVVATAEVKLGLSHVELEQRSLREMVAGIVQRLDVDAEDRRKGQEARAQEDRARVDRDKAEAKARRVILWAAVIGAFAAIMGALIGAVAVFAG